MTSRQRVDNVFDLDGPGLLGSVDSMSSKADVYIDASAIRCGGKDNGACVR